MNPNRSASKTEYVVYYELYFIMTLNSQFSVYFKENSFYIY